MVYWPNAGTANATANPPARGAILIAFRIVWRIVISLGARRFDTPILGRADDMIGGAKGERGDCACGVVARAGDKVASIHDEQIGHIVCPVELVDHRRLRILAHP